MIPSEFFRTAITAMVAHGFAADEVRRALDLKAASEVWGGPDFDGQPAWYLWLTSSPGAYRLRLVAAEEAVADGTAVLRGVFSIKYYPSRWEPVFRQHSPAERALIEGDAFDDTNTPRFDALDRIPETWFGVGTIEFTFDVGRGQAFLEYVSLDPMRFARSATTGRDGDAEGAPGGGARESRLRQLPAWDLGYPAFDALAGLQAFVSRRAPKRAILSRQAGFDFIEADGGALEPVDSDHTALKSLLLVFLPRQSRDPSPLEAAKTAAQLADPWTPLIDTAAQWATHETPGRAGVLSHHDHRHLHSACCRRSAAGGAEAGCCGKSDHAAHAASLHPVRVGKVIWEVPLAFNDHWWALAEAEHKTNTMPCGCR